LIPVESDAPEFIRLVHNALGVEWAKANKEHKFLFVGSCPCPRASTALVFQTSYQLMGTCIFCGANIEHIPIWMYEGGDKWTKAEKNLDGRFTLHTLTMEQSIAPGASAE